MAGLEEAAAAAVVVVTKTTATATATMPCLPRAVIPAAVAITSVLTTAWDRRRG